MRAWMTVLNGPFTVRRLALAFFVAVLTVIFVGAV
jgi:hypothetical protein